MFRVTTLQPTDQGNLQNVTDGGSSTETDNLTKVLRGAGQGEPAAAIDRAIPLIYQELRRLAGNYLRNQPCNHTLQPTALVHEVYLRLVDRSQSDWKDQAHLFYLAATIMRQVLVDHARAKVAAKRGGESARVEFNDSLECSNDKSLDLVALDDALKGLMTLDERKAKTLELRYFGGLNMKETAEVLGISVAAVGRDTRQAEAWLRRELQAASRHAI
jgi:RNA polymerase sigma factor (TIGR02999 family)